MTDVLRSTPNNCCSAKNLVFMWLLASLSSMFWCQRIYNILGRFWASTYLTLSRSIYYVCLVLN